jgi:tRNA nucleotidyltransferase/poly(A) polymerase
MKVQYKKGFDGHSSIILGNLKLDFSSNFNTLHIDQYLRDKGIDKPTSMQKELYSRDFTINTLLMDLELKTIHDPTNQGIKDLKAKIIKTCLSPEITLKEYNRIIRVIYLATKLDFDISPEIIDFVRKNPTLIESTTTEKALSEKLSKSMSYNPDKTLKLLKEMNLSKYIPIARSLSGVE